MEATTRLVVSPDEAAEILGICHASVYNRMADGTLPSFKIGGARRIPWAALEALIAQAGPYVVEHRDAA